MAVCVPDVRAMYGAYRIVSCCPAFTGMEKKGVWRGKG